jgi:hypothetical protein
MNKLQRFIRLTASERHLFLEAVFWCALVRLTMLMVPFRKYASLLGTFKDENGDSKDLNNETRRMFLEQISKAVKRASSYVPWKTRCFVEAIVAKRMLKYRNIPCTIYLGLKKVEVINDGELVKDMSAHAWLACGDFIVTGGQGAKLEQYTVVSTFE